MTPRSQQHYPPELRERAVRMVFEVQGDYDSQWAAIGAVAHKLGVGTAETERKWVRQAEVDGGVRPGTTSAETEELEAAAPGEHRAQEGQRHPQGGVGFVRGVRSTGHIDACEVHRRARRLRFRRPQVGVPTAGNVCDVALFCDPAVETAPGSLACSTSTNLFAILVIAFLTFVDEGVDVDGSLPAIEMPWSLAARWR